MTTYAKNYTIVLKKAYITMPLNDIYNIKTYQQKSFQNPRKQIVQCSTLGLFVYLLCLNVKLQSILKEGRES